MRAREIIYENREQHLRALMHKKKGDLRLAVVAKRRRYFTNATHASEILIRQLQMHFKVAISKHERNFGRERLTLGDLNKIRKKNMREVAAEQHRLNGINRMYGNTWNDIH